MIIKLKHMKWMQAIMAHFSCCNGNLCHMNVNAMVNLYFTWHNFLLGTKFYIINLSMHNMYVFVMHNLQK
jgi:hypothetical protein